MAAGEYSLIIGSRSLATKDFIFSRIGRCSGLASSAFSRLCLLFIHPRAPNLINLRSAGTMPA